MRKGFRGRAFLKSLCMTGFGRFFRTRMKKSSKGESPGIFSRKLMISQQNSTKGKGRFLGLREY
jgi:hypothetical protein